MSGVCRSCLSCSTERVHPQGTETYHGAAMSDRNRNPCENAITGLHSWGRNVALGCVAGARVRTREFLGSDLCPEVGYTRQSSDFP
jgi:hypothetical protein